MRRSVKLLAVVTNLPHQFARLLPRDVMLPVWHLASQRMEAAPAGGSDWGR